MADNNLSLSDEDFLNQPMPTDVEEEPVQDKKEEQSDSPQEEVDTNESEAKEESADSEAEEQPQENEDRYATSENEDSESDEGSQKESDEDAKENEIDYKAAYEQITSTFRANGKDMQVNNVDEALTLMKMGANYNKKMAALKPNLKLMKMLENNELLDESKLSYLIDLNKKNPDAIQKFIKDSGIDPLDIDIEKDTEYSPNTYTVPDSQLELDQILGEIQDTQSFERTVDVIGNKWDDNSRDIVSENPSLIKIINDHMETGIYDQINNIVENQRMLGNFKNLSDLQAYKQVGDLLQSEGKLIGNNQKPSANVKQATPESIATPEDDTKLKDRKRAAAPTKSKSRSKNVDSNYNPLSLSDDEFEKMVKDEFI